MINLDIPEFDFSSITIIVLPMSLQSNQFDFSFSLSFCSLISNQNEKRANDAISSENDDDEEEKKKI